MPKINKIPTEAEIYARLTRQCSTTEYAPADIKQKVIRAGLGTNAAERIADRLINEGYVNEERYTRAFVHDKFELNHWGRKKIEMALAQKGIRGKKVQDELAKIGDEKYQNTLADLLRAKNKSLRADNDRQRFQKLLSFAASRGFELNLAYEALETMIKSED